MLHANNPNKIKVLQIITSTVGGAGMHVAYLSQFLNDSIFSNRVAFTPGQHLDYRFHDIGTEIIPLQMGRAINLKGMLKDYVLLHKYIKENQIDIVHTHNTLAGLVGRLAAKTAGTPIVIHMIHTFAADPLASPLKKFTFFLLERVWDTFTDFYIAGSDYIRKKAVEQKICTEDKIRTIHYAIDTDAFLAVDTSPAQIAARRAKLNIAQNQQVITFVGRLEPQKAPHIFIKAFARVLQERPYTQALIVGDGYMKPELLQQCKRLGIEKNVTFLSWRKDIPEILSCTSVFCLPSDWEAFGIVFAEASLMEVPVVATNIEGIPEVVINEKSGFLVHKNSPDQVSRVIIKILENPMLARRMGKYGKQYVLEKFTIESMIQSHENLYSELYHTTIRLGIKTKVD
ncbi:MAG: glycosyltransferase [Ardenticatenaceae bacterium]|nr:glycosyltransferase [Anaerolineales bacterium]MCB8920935.1 glycosyltransferase [Ardenticatenaceae bacterium]